MIASDTLLSPETVAAMVAGRLPEPVAHAVPLHVAGTVGGCPACDVWCFCEEINHGRPADGADRPVCARCAADMAATGGTGVLATVTTYLTVYAPWDEGQDEPDKLSEDRRTWTVTTADACRESLAVLVAEQMCADGAYEYSGTPGWQPHGWWSAEAYEHPYTGTREERSFHLSGTSPFVHHLVWWHITRYWER